MSLRLGDLGGGQTRTWARPAGRRSPREKTGEANDPSQILGVFFHLALPKINGGRPLGRGQGQEGGDWEAVRAACAGSEGESGPRDPESTLAMGSVQESS